MPRYPIKSTIVTDWCRQADVDQSIYTLELSYQTDTNLFWAKMGRGAVVLAEYSTTPDLHTIDQVAINILREGKKLLEQKKAEDYLDMTRTLPDKPGKAISTPKS
jgi:hypothetical protein